MSAFSVVTVAGIMVNALLLAASESSFARVLVSIPTVKLPPA